MESKALPMPRRRLDVCSTEQRKEVATPPPAVNNPPSAVGALPSGKVRHFTPYLYLQAAVGDPRNLAHISRSERTVLSLCLGRAGRLGTGHECGPGEGMFARRREGIIADTGYSIGAVNLAFKNLRARGLVRWERLYERQTMPQVGDMAGGFALRKAICLFYVQVENVRALLGLARKAQERSMVDRSDRSHSASRLPQKPAEIPLPPSKIATEIPCDPLWLTINQTTETTGELRPPPPVGSGGELKISESNVDRVFAYWWRLVGRFRQDGDAPLPRTARSTQAAIARALADGYALDDLRLAIRARSDRRIGGVHFDFCEHPDRNPDRPIWAATMFEGPLDKLVASGRRYESNQRAALAGAPPHERDVERPSGADDGDDVATGLLAAGLVAPPPVDVVANPTPSWLSQPVLAPTTLAAFRDKRRPK
ncbi:MAG: hypothetical protein ACRDNM_00030 [Gaiellaceae bacterium]